MSKGTARYTTNIKPMAGGIAIAQLPVDGWVYGDKGLTDLTGFEHFYRANGERVELGTPCKVWLANLTVTNETEPTTNPDPEPETPPIVEGQYKQERYSPDGISWGEWTTYTRIAE